MLCTRSSRTFWWQAGFVAGKHNGWAYVRRSEQRTEYISQSHQPLIIYPYSSSHPCQKANSIRPDTSCSDRLIGSRMIGKH